MALLVALFRSVNRKMWRIRWHTPDYFYVWRDDVRFCMRLRWRTFAISSNGGFG